MFDYKYINIFAIFLTILIHLLLFLATYYYMDHIL